MNGTACSINILTIICRNLAFKGFNLLQMIVGLVIVSLVFFVLSTVLTERNASQLLSGYNTLSDEERSGFNIQGYVTHFRMFYRYFSIFYFVLCLLVYYLIDVDVAGFIIVLGPLIGVFIQQYTSKKFAQQNTASSIKLVSTILIGLMILVLGLIWLGYKENCMVFEKDGVLITGASGEFINYADIASVHLVKALPEISFKSGGFALGSVAKGTFKTQSDSTIKLLINSKQGPFIQLRKTNQASVYFHSNLAATLSNYVLLLQKLKAN